MDFVKVPKTKGDYEVIESKSLTGYLISNRYLIGRKIDQGSCGEVYKCVDVNNNETPLVLKVSDNRKLMKQEVKTLLMINEVQKMKKSNNSLLMTQSYGYLH